ncbi:MAG: fatty acid cis/trans isomerase, partial [Gammaproteobacteria bacterium]|nr:fatty acid cis/trans isomerase [Gammaproteobacteria bacterium]
MSNKVRVLALLVIATVLSNCTTAKQPSLTTDQATVDYDLILDPKTAPVSWDEHVKPVVEGRCVVCHACYDASCQLKLSSYEGLVRGANPQKVYDGARIRATEPTRLFVDGKTTADWRAKGFHPVMSETTGTKTARLEDSVLYRILRLKQLNPQPRTGMLPDAVTVELDRKQVCTTEENFDKFAEENPLWGMPYGMPNLSDAEYGTLVRWLAQGAPPPSAHEPSAAAASQIAQWERFLNGQSLREKLMSRYVYEHLFIGHLHFAGTPEREFYRLVRSWTPPGEPIDEVATTMPFGDPGTRPFWYRLWLDHQSVVAKDHVVYEWSGPRMNRYRELFLEPEYQVTALPSYDPVL